jgi:amino acid transporter
MTALWTIIGILLVIVWVISLVDIFRRHYSVGATIGYLALILIVPFIGTIIYWAVRKPSAAEIEHAYRAEADVRHSAASRPFDSTGV